MSNPLSSLLAQTKIGFTRQQKVLITVIGAAYILSPLDVVPDLIFPLGFIDDAYVLYVLIRVWASPTLPAATHAAPSPPPQAPSVPPQLIHRPEIVADVTATAVESRRDLS